MRLEIAFQIGLPTIAVLFGIDGTFGSEESLLPSYTVLSQRNAQEKEINETQLWRNNISSFTETRIYCSGAMYGWDLQQSSCRDAVLQFEPTREIETFGNRHQGDFDIPLPSRTLSG